VDNYVIHKRALGVQHCGIVRLTDGELGSIVHRNMLNGGQRSAWRFAGANANVAHVADVKNTHAPAHCFVLGHQAAARRVFDGHIPPAEIDHFRAQLPVQRVQRRFAEFVFGGRVYGVHPTRSGRKS